MIERNRRMFRHEQSAVISSLICTGVQINQATENRYRLACASPLAEKP
ncbi:hypothetical protein [Paraburkholderia sp.]|nr:hypothetical protein [Paraburkholderia sp.]